MVYAASTVFQLLILFFLVKFYNTYPFFVYPVAPEDGTGVTLWLNYYVGFWVKPS